MTKRIFTVGQINRYLCSMLDEDEFLADLSVSGEISNFKRHSSGHLYFTLKDSQSTLYAIMFRNAADKISFSLQDGDKVVVHGRIGVYEAGGRYQLYVNSIQKEGIGDLYQQFELLKQHLSEEGMFASEYKHSIPQFARTVGIVTAPTGAAVRDIIQNAKRRNPYIQLILYPALVQGDGAVASIVTGIRTLDALGVDCMIIGRGGGSIEDLWAFNEEEVARAIFASNTPIISAVGHENDWTIADFVSDFRASTPTAAVEFAVFDYQQFESDLYQKQSFFQQRMSYIISSYRNETMEYTRNLKHLNPRTLLMNKRQQCIEFAEKLENSFGHQFDQKKHQLQLLTQQLDGLSPLKKLSSGYSYVSTVEGVHVTCASQVKLDDELSIYLSKGSIQAKVTEVIQ